MKRKSFILMLAAVSSLICGSCVGTSGWATQKKEASAMKNRLGISLSPQWTLYRSVLFPDSEMKNLSAVPERIGDVRGESVSPDVSGLIEILPPGGAIVEKTPALLLNEFESSDEGVLQYGFGADWYMKIFINGKCVLDRLAIGNGSAPSKDNFVLDLPVRKGKNLLAVQVLSGSGGWCFVSGKVAFRDLSLTAPTLKRFREMRHAKTYPAEGTPERLLWCEAIQNGVDRMRSDVFAEFDSRNDIRKAELEKIYRKYPVLYFYDSALDRILDELPRENVPEGRVAIWMLYNMGYVVKTHDTCFGIDLHHRRAEKLEPYLDFLLTTHNHGDHFNTRLLRAMTGKGKKIISNFFPAPGYSRPPEVFRFGKITIFTEETDHNNFLRKFMTTFRIVCGTGKSASVIYHTGDSCNAAQLNPGPGVNYYIVHPRVGLKTIDAVKKFRPACTLVSHLLEMGHCPPSQWIPVPFRDARNDTMKIQKLGLSFRIPLWGEKL